MSGEANGRAAGAKSKATETRPAETRPAEAQAARMNGNGPKRRDQVQCPKCGRWGCPCEGGSFQRVTGTTRYRTCNGCHHEFVTFQQRGSEIESVIG